jgi:polar amino acid transport system substrate-binding protein
LRAGINLSNFLLVNDRAENGDPVGVSPSMAAALATNLGVGLELITFANPGEVADAAPEGVWDIGNIGADPARAEHIDFTAAYAEILSTYLVRGASPITSIDEVDRPGNRVVTKARAAYALWLERNLAHAELVLTDTIPAAAQRFAEDQSIDVLAGLLPRLLEDQEAIEGSRILDGHFTAVQQAIGTPKGRDQDGFAHLQAFVDAAVRSGFVAELIAFHAVRGLSPAPR